MFKTSAHGQIFLDYVNERHKHYMGLPMASLQIRAMNELLMISRFITISDDHFVAKLTGYAYYQGIIFWISKVFELTSTIPDNNESLTLIMLEDKVMKSRAKVSNLVSICKCVNCSDYIIVKDINADLKVGN